MEKGIFAVLGKQGMHKNTQVSPRQALKIATAAEELWLSLNCPLCCPDWTQQFHPTPDCQICAAQFILTLQLPSLYPPLFQPILIFNFKSLFKQKDTLGLKHISYFSHSLLLPFSQQKITLRCSACSVRRNFPLPKLISPTRASNHSFYAAPCTAA